MPVHFLSVEHIKLQERYGREMGIRIGEYYGLISGWVFFKFWIGIWISTQPRFTIPFFHSISILLPYTNSKLNLLNLIFSIPFLLSGAWFGIRGLKDLTFKVAETHRTEKIVTTGVYSLVRHPQYLGGLFAHVGISFLLSAWYSILSTPLMVLINYLISWKEEEELVKEYGMEYENYKKMVPMLIPRLKRRARSPFKI